MIHKRYYDKSKLLVDANELQLVNRSEVLIYREDQWCDEVVVDLEEQAEKFEELKPLIVFVAENLCKMDCIAQKYSRDGKFAYGYIVGFICFNIPDLIKLRYYGTTVNTEFDVIFQHENGEFILKSFGMVKNIQPDWDK